MSETATDQVPHPTPEHRLLNVFVGQWAAEGDSYTGELSPGQPHRSTVNWRSDESYTWLPGEFFLEHRFDALAGDRALRGIEILPLRESWGRGNHSAFAWGPCFLGSGTD